MGVFVNRGAAYILVSTLLAASIAPAQAENQVLWRCDAPNGHYDQQLFPIPGTAATISGKLIVNKAYFGPTWNSIARITVAKGGSGGCHCSGLSLVASDNPVIVNYSATANGADIAVAQSGYRTPVPFRISFGPENMMTIQIGNEKPQTKAVRLLHPEHDFLVMSCSGADLSFLDVQIQYDFRGKSVTHAFEEQDRLPG